MMIVGGPPNLPARLPVASPSVQSFESAENARTRAREEEYSAPQRRGHKAAKWGRKWGCQKAALEKVAGSIA